MVLQLGALREALLEAGATPAAANKAAEELAGYDREFVSIHTELGKLRNEMDVGFVSVRSDMAAEFASVRREVDNGFASVRSEMASEFASVRSEMASEFASVRSEMASKFTSVRNEMTSEFASVRREMDGGFASVRAEMARLNGEMTLMKWMLGSVLGIVLAVALKLFIH